MRGDVADLKILLVDVDDLDLAVHRADEDLGWLSRVPLRYCNVRVHRKLLKTPTVHIDDFQKPRLCSHYKNLFCVQGCPLNLNRVVLDWNRLD